MSDSTAPYIIAVVVPLSEEFEVITSVFPIEESLSIEGESYYYLQSDPESIRLVAVILREMGPSQASHKTSRLIEHIAPDLLVLIGIAGSLSDDVRLGDVVVADETIEFLSASRVRDEGKNYALTYSGAHWRSPYAWIELIFHFQNVPFSGFERWHKSIENCHFGFPDRAFGSEETYSRRVHIGHMASGEFVVASANYRAELRGLDRKLLAIEMESAGVIRAAQSRSEPVDLLVLRGISDNSDPLKASLERSSQGEIRHLAVCSAATFLKEFLRWERVQLHLRRRVVPDQGRVVPRKPPPASAASDMGVTGQTAPPISADAGAGKGPCIESIIEDLGDAPLDESALGLAPRLLSVRKVLHQRPQSVVALVAAEGQAEWVIKRSPRSMCDVETLGRLVGKDIVGYSNKWHGLSLTVSTPLALRITAEHVFELHRYYRGRTLQSIIERNKHCICGHFLGDLYNALMIAIAKLHGLEVLHRDVRPMNILLLDSGQLMLLDVTFCCEPGRAAYSVANRPFSPPEQLHGERVGLDADRYSVAASIVFLATGLTPQPRNRKSLVEMLRGISVGGHSATSHWQSQRLGLENFSGMLLEMLRPDPRKRPSDFWDLLLSEGTHPTLGPVLAIIELRKGRYLLLEEYDYHTLSSAGLQKYVQQPKVGIGEWQISADLLAEVKEHLRGGRPWLRRYPR